MKNILFFAIFLRINTLFASDSTAINSPAAFGNPQLWSQHIQAGAVSGKYRLPIIINVDVAQAAKKSLLVNYEQAISRHWSLFGEFGAKTHHYQAPGLYQFTYTKTTSFNLFEQGTKYENKPKTWGDFLPTRTRTFGISARYFIKPSNVSGLFIQSGFTRFRHSGHTVKETESLTSYLHNKDLIFDWFGTTIEEYLVEKEVSAQETTKKTAQYNFGAGYRLVAWKRLILDAGVVFIYNLGYTNDAVRYYGINPVYGRGFVTLGVNLN